MRVSMYYVRSLRVDGPGQLVRTLPAAAARSGRSWRRAAQQR